MKGDTIMENENVLNENVELTNVEDEVTYGVADDSSNGGLFKVVLGLGACAAAVGAGLHFTKKKRDELTIKRLKKKGYTVIEPDVVDDYEDAEYVEFEEVETEDEK